MKDSFNSPGGEADVPREDGNTVDGALGLSAW